jgi:hypothetical protein
MGAKELIGGAKEHVHVERSNVDESVRRKMNRVRDRESSDSGGALRDGSNVRNRSQGIRSERECDDPGALVECVVERIEIEAEVT